jgi:predicted nucleotidyltransferase
LDETVATLSAAYCARIDAAHPGALTGLYLVGSIALGDYRPGISDVDFIAVLDPPLSEDAIVALHNGLRAQIGAPYFDGIYVDAQALARDPRTVAPGFSVVEGHVRGPDRDERHPVTWLTLARHGIAIRGRASSVDWVWSDLAAAQQHARENLRSYWQRQLDWHRSQLEASASLTDDMVVWAVLGVGRLHAMIAAGLLLSKGQAAEYERAAFPDHQPIIVEAMLLRLGQPVVTSFRTPAARHQAVIDFLDAVIADGLAWSD